MATAQSSGSRIWSTSADSPSFGLTLANLAMAVAARSPNVALLFMRKRNAFLGFGVLVSAKSCEKICTRTDLSDEGICLMEDIAMI
jgi:hypothetical protein